MDELLCGGIAGDVEAGGRFGKESETQSLGKVGVGAGRIAELGAGEGRSGLCNASRQHQKEEHQKEEHQKEEHQERGRDALQYHCRRRRTTPAQAPDRRGC